MDSAISLLRYLPASPGEPVDSNFRASDDDLRKIARWNATATDFPRTACVHELFEAQADLSHDAPAVVEGTSVLTYRRLDERANQLAWHLRALGIGPEALVGVCLDRSADMVVAFLGILKAGGAYLPLDACSPRERLEFMLSDGRVSVLLTQASLAEAMPGTSIRTICLDRDWPIIAREPPNRPPSGGPTADGLAYVIYTSGSTGEPKGVAVTHRNIVRLVRGQEYADFGPGERFLLLASPAFDASTFELWGPLLNGGSCVAFPDRWPDPLLLEETIRRHRITCMWLTAGLFNHIVDRRPSTLATVKHVITGGEALSGAHVQRALDRLPDLRLTNGYGPTECTTFACTYAIGRDRCWSGRTVPIGRPIANTCCFILDERRNIVPIGASGELYIGGDGVARGYFNRPDLTAERFLPNRFAADARARLYRTGDLCRWLDDGTIEFLGRIDRQVKIRGYRVEPAAIEATLVQHHAVSGAAVVARAGVAGTRRLAAYIVPVRDAAPNAEMLRAHLARTLPDYMVPATFTFLNELPLTANGKVDRDALPEPAFERPPQAGEWVPPRSPDELLLARIWSELLRVSGIGVRDDFFALGGDSLLAVEMFAAIRRDSGLDLPMGALAQSTTIEGLARLLRNGASARLFTSLVPIQTAGARTPFFCVHGGSGNVASLPKLARQLPADQPFYALQWDGLDGSRGQRTIEDMAAHYLAEIRGVQANGPYLLGGQCVGGLIALEMAQQLMRCGEKVALLVLFDSPNLASPLYRRRRKRRRLIGRRRLLGMYARLLLGLRIAPEDRLVHGIVAMAAAGRRYRPQPPPGRALYFSSGEYRGDAIGLAGEWSDRAMGWSPFFSPDFEHHPIAAAHDDIPFHPDTARILARALEEYGDTSGLRR